MENYIEIERHGEVGVIALNRPKARNAINTALLLDLRKAIKEASVDAKMRSVILTGRGGAFSAGADVREWAEKKEGNDPYPTHDWVEECIKMIQDVARLPKPTIAMIDGAAVGAGLDMALACDFRYASERAKFICSYIRVGYPPDCGGTWLMPRIIGIESAKRFAFTGEVWDAPTAKANRMVSEVFAAAELFDRTLDFASRLAAGPTVAIALAKKLIDNAHGRTLAEQQLEEQAAGRICAATKDHAEGLAAANERREPRFIGA
jgi:2-(1,2-epoxy-1,2-dihydrophenyl)acetyl-CoA isomerase